MKLVEDKLFYHKHQFVPKDRTLELYFTGCSIKCKNCQNYFLQERNEENTRIISVQELISELQDYPSITRQVHILGGEPLEQNLEVEVNVKLFKKDELGKKEYRGILKSFNKDEIVLETEENNVNIERKNISQIKTVYNW